MPTHRESFMSCVRKTRTNLLHNGFGRDNLTPPQRREITARSQPYLYPSLAILLRIKNQGPERVSHQESTPQLSMELNLFNQQHFLFPESVPKDNGQDGGSTNHLHATVVPPCDIERSRAFAGGGSLFLENVHPTKI